MKIKFISKTLKEKSLIVLNREELQTKNMYKKPNINHKAPNCVQKNIRYAASTHRLVLAKLYRIKNDGISKVS
jgi:hypothetical protein